MSMMTEDQMYRLYESVADTHTSIKWAWMCIVFVPIAIIVAAMVQRVAFLILVVICCIFISILVVNAFRDKKIAMHQFCIALYNETTERGVKGCETEEDRAIIAERADYMGGHYANKKPFVLWEEGRAAVAAGEYYHLEELEARRSKDAKMAQRSVVTYQRNGSGAEAEIEASAKAAEDALRAQEAREYEQERMSEVRIANEVAAGADNYQAHDTKSEAQTDTPAEAQADTGSDTLADTKQDAGSDTPADTKQEQ